MKKKIDVNLALTPGECGCGHDAHAGSDTHSAHADHDCACGGAHAAHQHEDNCCGAANMPHAVEGDDADSPTATQRHQH